MNNKEKQELVRKSATRLFKGYDKSLVMQDVSLDVFSRKDGIKDMSNSVLECMSIWAEVMKEYTSLLNKVKQEVFGEDDRTLTFSVKDLTETQKQILSQMFATPERMYFDKDTLEEVTKSICYSCKYERRMVDFDKHNNNRSEWIKCELDMERKDGVMACVNYTKK